MGNLLQKIDVLGDNFELDYKGKKTFRTTVGGICSLLAYIVIVLLFIKTMFSFMDRGSPELNSAVSNNQEAPEIDLVQSNVFPIIRISVGQWFQFVSADKLPSFITITSTINEVTINQDDPTLSKGKMLLNIPYKDCTTITSVFKDRMYELMPKMKKMSEGYAYCPDITDESLFKISGDYLSDVRKILVINIFPCNSDTTTCETVTAKIDTIQAQVTLPGQSFLAENFKNPVTLPLDIKDVPAIHRQILKKTIFYFKQNTIFDDTRDIQDPVMKSTYYDIDWKNENAKPRSDVQISCTNAEFTAKTCVPYIQFEFASSTKKLVTFRKYPKFIQSAADFGGLAELVILLTMPLFVTFFFFKKKKPTDFIKSEILQEDSKKVVQKLDVKSKSDGDKLLDNMLNDRTNGIELFKKLNKLELLEEFLFEDHDRVLYRYAMLNQRYKRYGTKDRDDPKMTYEEAYQKLVNFNPENETKKAWKAFMLNNVPSIKQLESNADGIEAMSKNTSEFYQMDENAVHESDVLIQARPNSTVIQNEIPKFETAKSSIIEKI